MNKQYNKRINNGVERPCSLLRCYLLLVVPVPLCWRCCCGRCCGFCWRAVAPLAARLLRLLCLRFQKCIPTTTKLFPPTVIDRYKCQADSKFEIDHVSSWAMASCFEEEEVSDKHCSTNNNTMPWKPFDKRQA